MSVESYVGKLENWGIDAPQLSLNWKDWQAMAQAFVPAMFEEVKQVAMSGKRAETKKVSPDDESNAFKLFSEAGDDFNQVLAPEIEAVIHLQEEELAVSEARIIFGLPTLQEGGFYSYLQVCEAYLQLGRDELAIQAEMQKKATQIEMLITHIVDRWITQTQIAQAKRYNEIDESLKTNEEAVERFKNIAGNNTQLTELMTRGEIEPNVNQSTQSLLAEKRRIENWFGKVGQARTVLEKFLEGVQRTVMFEAGRSPKLTQVATAA